VKCLGLYAARCLAVPVMARRARGVGDRDISYSEKSNRDDRRFGIGFHILTPLFRAGGRTIRRAACSWRQHECRGLPWQFPREQSGRCSCLRRTNVFGPKMGVVPGIFEALPMRASKNRHFLIALPGCQRRRHWLRATEPTGRSTASFAVRYFGWPE
jgi:hypothetical protein